MRRFAPIDTSEFRKDCLTWVNFHDDDSYSVYLGDQWLAHEDTKKEAIDAAIFRAYMMDAWSQDQASSAL